MSRGGDGRTTRVMKVLANERRLRILALLRDPVASFPPQTDGDLVDDGVCLVFIADELGISQPAASRHMELLISIGCIVPKPLGRWTFYRRDEAGIRAALELIQGALDTPGNAEGAPPHA